MALVPCKTCGQMIAANARSCPQCGAPRYAARLKRSLLFLLPEIAVVVIVMAWLLSRVGLLKIGMG